MTTLSIATIQYAVWSYSSTVAKIKVQNESSFLLWRKYKKEKETKDPQTEKN
jgi:hypothetical protein